MIAICIKCSQQFIPSAHSIKKGWYVCEPCRYLREKQKKQQMNESEYGLYLAKKRSVEKGSQKVHFRVRKKTQYHIKHGNIIRKPCEICGDNASEAHHDDYNRPLDIRWLCKKHHREYHRIERLKKLTKLADKP